MSYFTTLKNDRNTQLIMFSSMFIKYKRKSEGIIQSQLGFESGTARFQISRIERGTVDSSISTLKAIFDALDTNFGEFHIFILENSLKS